MSFGSILSYDWKVTSNDTSAKQTAAIDGWERFQIVIEIEIVAARPSTGPTVAATTRNRVKSPPRHPTSTPPSGSSRRCRKSSKRAKPRNARRRASSNRWAFAVFLPEKIYSLRSCSELFARTSIVGFGLCKKFLWKFSSDISCSRRIAPKYVWHLWRMVTSYRDVVVHYDVMPWRPLWRHP